MRGSDDDSDPLFLQVKEAQPSVLEPFTVEEPLPAPRPAGRRGAVADAGGGRHLPRLADGGGRRRRGARLLRAPALGLEDLGRRGRDDAQGAARLRARLRLDAGARPRPDRRPLRDRGLRGQGRVARPGDDRLRREIRRPEREGPPGPRRRRRIRPARGLRAKKETRDERQGHGRQAGDPVPDEGRAGQGDARVRDALARGDAADRGGPRDRGRARSGTSRRS